jgi:hypothetical protein
MKLENAAKAVARGMEWAGARGGWIFDRDRQPLAPGWHALAGRLEARGWIVDRGPGVGFVVDWGRIPAPGTVRQRADGPLSPDPKGPTHPDHRAPPPPERAPRTLPGEGRPLEWYIVPNVFRVGMSPDEIGAETIAAWNVAALWGATSATITGSEAAAHDLADTLTAQTGIVWNAVPAGRPGQF